MEQRKRRGKKYSCKLLWIRGDKSSHWNDRSVAQLDQIITAWSWRGRSGMSTDFGMRAFVCLCCIHVLIVGGCQPRWCF